MANYRNISINFWTDSKVDDDFTPEDKYFYLYLLTNPHTNLSGCYEISMKQMERETGYNTDTVKRVIQRLQNEHGVVEYCGQTKEVLIKNWCKYNWAASEKVKKAIISVATHIKNQPFKEYVMNMVSIQYGYDIDTVCIPNPPVTVTVTESDTVSETESVSVSEYRDSNSDSIRAVKGETDVSPPPTKPKRFIKPSLEEVKTYCQERQNNVDAERFVDYYEANGWKVGKNPMKDWKAAVRTWERNRYDRSETDKSSVPDDISKYNCVVNQF